MPTVHVAFWSDDAAGLCDLLQSSPNGLTSADSGERLKQYGPNTIEAHRESTWWRIIWNQLLSENYLMADYGLTTHGHGTAKTANA